MSHSRPKVLVSNSSGKSVVIEHYDERAPKRKKPAGQNSRKNKSARTTTFQVKGSLQDSVAEPSAGPSRLPNLQPPASAPAEPTQDREFLSSNQEQGQQETKNSKKQVWCCWEPRFLCSSPLPILESQLLPSSMEGAVGRPIPSLHVQYRCVPSHRSALPILSRIDRNHLQMHHLPRFLHVLSDLPFALTPKSSYASNSSLECLFLGEDIGVLSWSCSGAWALWSTLRTELHI